MAAAALASLLALPPVTAGQHLAGAVAVSVAEHRVDAGAGVEVSAGPLVSVGGQAAVGRRWLALLDVTSGTLSAEGGGPDRDFAELRAGLAFRATPWLTIEAGFGTRTYAAAIAVQRWTAATFGAAARLPLGGDGLAGIGRFAVQPSVKVSNLDAASAFLAAAGVEYRANRMTFELTYGLERYAFPAAAGVVRNEQLALLVARATWSPGGTR